MTIADELVKLEQLRDRGGLSPEEFSRAKLCLLESPRPTDGSTAALNGFRRSRTDRWFGGLCGGLAVSTGVDSWVWRLLFALLFFAGGTGLLLYVLFWIFVPSE